MLPPKIKRPTFSPPLTPAGLRELARWAVRRGMPAPQPGSDFGQALVFMTKRGAEDIADVFDRAEQQYRREKEAGGRNEA